MATAAQELFSFIQARQRVSLDQDKFAEAKRQFNVNAELNGIQQQQNSRRLDLLKEAQEAMAVDQREGRRLQERGIDITKAATEQSIEDSKFRNSLTLKQLLQSGQFVQGEGTGPESLVPVDPAVLEQESFERKTDKVFSFAEDLQKRGGLNKKESFAVSAGTPALVQQPTQGQDRGLNAALLNARFGQETMGVIGQAMAKAGEQGKNFESLDITEIAKLIDEEIKSSEPQINQMFGTIMSNPSSSLRAAAINSIQNTRSAQRLKAAQAQRAGGMDVGQALLLQQLSKSNPELLKFMGITLGDPDQ